MNNPYLEGYETRKAMKPRNNPYSEDDPQFTLWERGWFAAKTVQYIESWTGRISPMGPITRLANKSRPELQRLPMAVPEVAAMRRVAGEQFLKQGMAVTNLDFEALELRVVHRNPNFQQISKDLPSAKTMREVFGPPGPPSWLKQEFPPKD